MSQILKENQGARQEKGEFARLSAFLGGMAVADLVKSTLGPKGMDKILQSVSGKGITITNDGATILRSVPVENPAAKMIVDTSITQDSEVGDGTTSVAVLAGELLREAEKLVMAHIHPQTIIRGWRKALKVARDALHASSIDNSNNPEKFREDLISVARTTLSSKILATDDDYFAKLAVDAVLRLDGSDDLNMIQIVKKLGGNLRDSYLDSGFILDKRFCGTAPRRIENARVMIANTSMDQDKIKIYGAKVKVDSISSLAEIEDAEKYKMKMKVDKILKHDINVFINRQLIYNYPEQLLNKAGVSTIEHADFEGVERLALVLGADVASAFDDPKNTRIGTCSLIEEIIIGEDRAVKFHVENSKACSVILRGTTNETLEEAVRALHDAICAVHSTIKHSKTSDRTDTMSKNGNVELTATEVETQRVRGGGIVRGGGASELLMSNAIEQKLLPTINGKEYYAVEAFARALRVIPATLADNAGFDSTELIANLRKLHADNQHTMGINMNTGKIDCMARLNVTESFFSKNTSLHSAHEVAEQLVRCDSITYCSARPRNGGDACSNH